MINKVILILFALSLLLSACQGGETTGELPATDPGPTVIFEDFGTELAPATQPARSPVATGEAGPVKTAQCTVVSANPTPGPTEQSLFPPVGAGDWVHGPETADVTIIEYSDFM